MLRLNAEQLSDSDLVGECFPEDWEDPGCSQIVLKKPLKGCTNQFPPLVDAKLKPAGGLCQESNLTQIPILKFKRRTNKSMSKGVVGTLPHPVTHSSSKGNTKKAPSDVSEFSL